MTATGGSLRVGFLHPDLGLGGAERLVVDAAVELQNLGHEVTIFTAHHDPDRAFEETRDGTLRVKVFGDRLPMHVAQRLRAPCSIARTAYVAARLVGTRERFDVVLCDVVAHAIPVLKRLGRVPVVFYCNFPDRLLAPPGGRVYRLYRWPIDRLEEASLARSDRVLVNSRFTAEAFRRVFPRLDAPEVVHPGTNVETMAAVAPYPADAPDATILSIARFERAKGAVLAVDALGALREIDARAFARARLVVAGGYDDRLDENRRTYAELRERASRLKLGDRVEFRLSVTDTERMELLSRSLFVVYTPRDEHFGLVPIEAMAAGRAVVAVASGGPVETIVDGETGLLCPPDASSFAGAFAQLISDRSKAARMGAAGRRHVETRFSRAAFGRRLNEVLREVVATARAGTPRRRPRS